MFTRRFVLLTGVLVTLNLALWFASPGLALPRSIVQQLFGSRMVRAEVFLKNGSDWHLDRGVIKDVTSSQLTLKEVDGLRPISISASTKVVHLGQPLSVSVLAPRWRVVVLWPANGPARTVVVERIPQGRHKAVTG